MYTLSSHPSPRGMGLGIPAQAGRSCLGDLLSPAPLPASSSHCSRCLTAPLTPAPQAWRWQLLTVCFRTGRKLPILERCCHNFPASWSRGFLTALPPSFLFENPAQRAAFRILQRTKSCGWGLCRCPLSTPTPATFQRPRETWLPHSVYKCSEWAHVLWKTHPGFKMLLLHHIILPPQTCFLCANFLMPSYKWNSKKSSWDFILQIFTVINFTKYLPKNLQLNNYI